MPRMEDLLAEGQGLIEVGGAIVAADLVTNAELSATQGVFQAALTTDLNVSNAGGTVMSGSFAPLTSAVVVHASFSGLNVTQFSKITLIINGTSYGMGIVTADGRKATRPVALTGLTVGAEVTFSITYASASGGNLLCRAATEPADEHCVVVVDRATTFP